MMDLPSKNTIQNQKIQDKKLFATKHKCINKILKDNNSFYPPPGSIVYNTVPKYFDVIR